MSFIRPMGAQPFDAPVVVSSGAAGTQYLFPPDRANQRRRARDAYYQGMASSANALMLATSADGKAWTSKSVAAPGTFTLSRVTPDWLGDYFGLTATDAAVFLAYGDNTGRNDAYRVQDAHALNPRARSWSPDRAPPTIGLVYPSDMPHPTDFG